jgi:DNA-binding transcriptional ArsR family regulator
MENFQPEKRYIIRDLETLRIMADPLRAQIYEILIREPASVRQVAERMGLAPSRLYYHVNLLEKHNLLRVVETRMVANMLEKSYRAVALEFEVAPELLNFSEENRAVISEMLASTLDATREDLLRSISARLFELEQGEQEKQRSLMITRVNARISDRQAEEFRARLAALLEEFSSQDAGEGPAAAAQNYALMLAFYPSFYYPESDKNAA